MSNPNYVKTGGSWVNATECHVKSGGSWVEADEGYKKISGTWTKFYDKHTSGGTTTKVQVTIAQFDESNACACSLTSTTQIWEDSDLEGGAGLSLSVNDWVHDGSSCAQVTAVNATGSADSYTASGPSSCDDCNQELFLCEDMGEGGYCLLPHMLVKLFDGSFTKVINLSLGDLIEAPSGFTEVNSLIKNHPRDGYYIIENELYISDDHPILINGEMIKAKDYPGNKRYVKLSTDTVYVGTVLPTFNVYCENNTYTVDGHYGTSGN